MDGKINPECKMRGHFHGAKDIKGDCVSFRVVRNK